MTSDVSVVLCSGIADDDAAGAAGGSNRRTAVASARAAACAMRAQTPATAESPHASLTRHQCIGSIRTIEDSQQLVKGQCLNHFRLNFGTLFALALVFNASARRRCARATPQATPSHTHVPIAIAHAAAIAAHNETANHADHTVNSKHITRCVSAANGPAITKCAHTLRAKRRCGARGERAAARRRPRRRRQRTLLLVLCHCDVGHCSHTASNFAILNFENTMGSVSEFLKEGTKYLTGLEEAILRNIEAVKQLSDMTRTSLGPNGA
jgi:hypothetical protein